MYSTCSILPEENDEVVGKFLKEHSNFEVVYKPSKLNGVKTELGIQFVPHISQGAGFYYSVLTRKK